MGHLNELQEKYKDKGLTVLAISGQDKTAVSGFVEEFGAKYPTISESSDSMEAYDCNSYPSAFLIDTGGRITWAGHPGELQESAIDDLLANAKILPDWPDDLKDAHHEFEKLDYTKALEKTEKALEKDDLEEGLRATAEKIRDWLLWYGTARLEAAQADVDGGRFYEASVALEEVQDLYKHHDLADQAGKKLDELLSDKDRKLEVKAGEKLAKILEKIRGESPKKALKLLKPMLSRKYEDTAAGKKALSLAEKLEKEA